MHVFPMFPSFAILKEFISVVKQKHILLLETILFAWQNWETYIRETCVRSDMLLATRFFVLLGHYVFWRYVAKLSTFVKI